MKLKVIKVKETFAIRDEMGFLTVAMIGDDSGDMFFLNVDGDAIVSEKNGKVSFANEEEI